MVRKGTTSVYTDLDQVKRAKEIGLDLSSITSKALEIVDSDEFADIAVEMRRKINDDIIYSTREEILRLETRLTYLRERLANAVAKDTEITAEWETTKRTVMLSRYIYQLNMATIAAEYNVPTIRETAKEIIAKIVEINPLFQLEVHVREFQKEMNR